MIYPHPDEEGLHDPEDWFDGDSDGDPDFDADPDLIDGIGFADPGGNSALRAETPRNPRNLPCPRCHAPDVLTPLDRHRGYVCDRCADAAERGTDGGSW